MQFSELGLHDQLLTSLSGKDFNEPTAIQKATISKALGDQDLIACAKTGSGKTLAYLLPILHRLLESPREEHSPFALILAPTRELAIQIQKEAAELVSVDTVSSQSIYGGADYEKQKQKLSSGVQVLVATPGRLLDFIRSKDVSLESVEYIVLDEADRMLDMGFIDDVKKILSYTKSRKQVSLFSATLNYSAVYSVWRFMNEPEEILINPELIDHSKIKQSLIHLGKEEKLPYLIQHIESVNLDPIIIFTNTKQFVEVLVKNLNYHNIPAQGLSSVVNQKKRMKILDQFKERSFRILVATDVASRGLHIDDVALVINYDIPQDPETYVHRIGRTARAGASGEAISISSEMDYEELMKLERYLKYKLDVAEPDVKFLDNLAFVKVDLTISDRPQNRGRQGRGSAQSRDRVPNRKKANTPNERKTNHKKTGYSKDKRQRKEDFKKDPITKPQHQEVFDVVILNQPSRGFWSRLTKLLFPWRRKKEVKLQPSAQTLERLRREENNNNRKPGKKQSRKFDGRPGKKNYRRPYKKRQGQSGENS